MNDNVYVVGHKNPDTDSICAAICLSKLKEVQGETNVLPARTNETNSETDFVLEKFDLEKPQVLEDASDKKIILVDHNEYSQAVEGAEEAEIVEVLDHHRIGDVETSGPIPFHVEPVGSTSTLIYERFKEQGIEPSESVKGALFSAILSDTVIFRSPTTTERDEKAGEELAADLGLDPVKYGKEMFKVKSNIDEKSAREAVVGDFKEYDIGEHKIGVNQIETVTPETAMSRKDEFLEAMEQVREERGYTFMINLVTDLLEENSKALFVGDEKESFEQAFDVKLEDNEAFLEGVLSRKKQVIPNLESVLG